VGPQHAWGAFRKKESLGTAEGRGLPWVTEFSPLDGGGGPNAVGTHLLVLVFSTMENYCGLGTGILCRGHQKIYRLH